MEIKAPTPYGTCQANYYTCMDGDPLPPLLDGGNDWSLLGKLVRRHSLTDLGSFEDSNSSRCFPLTKGGIELLGISTGLGDGSVWHVQVKYRYIMYHYTHSPAHVYM